MKSTMTSIIAVGFAIFSCNTGRNSVSNDEISGAYAKEYSFKVLNPETKKEVGMRTIRDTIFIKITENDYRVSNKKWKLNDYDKEGWQNMEHSEDRPVTAYSTIFENDDSSLNPIQPGLGLSLFVDLANKTVCKSKDHKDVYRRVQ